VTVPPGRRGLEPATSSLGNQTLVESKSLARFCCEFLNLQHLAESAKPKFIEEIEAQMRQRIQVRVEALERKVPDAAPQRRNSLVQLAIAAMAGAWRPDEIEEILVASEALLQLDKLPPGLRRRWTQHLDHLSLQRFGKTFGGLLASTPTNPFASTPAKSETLVYPPQKHSSKGVVPCQKKQSIRKDPLRVVGKEASVEPHPDVLPVAATVQRFLRGIAQRSGRSTHPKRHRVVFEGRHSRPRRLLGPAPPTS
jgi:hypothetical protein